MPRPILPVLLLVLSACPGRTLADKDTDSEMLVDSERSDSELDTVVVESPDTEQVVDTDLEDAVDTDVVDTDAVDTDAADTEPVDTDLVSPRDTDTAAPVETDSDLADSSADSEPAGDTPSLDSDPQPRSCAVSVVVTTVFFAAEVSWELRDETGTVLAAAPTGSYGNQTVETGSFVVPAGDHEFVAMDSFGDGWNGGSFQLLGADGAVIAAGALGDGDDDGVLQVFPAPVTCPVPDTATGDSAEHSDPAGPPLAVCAAQIRTRTGLLAAEMGWSISSAAGGVLVDRPAGSFADFAVNESLLSLVDDDYTLSLTDASGDGWTGGAVDLMDAAGGVLLTASLGDGDDNGLAEDLVFTQRCTVPGDSGDGRDSGDSADTAPVDSEGGVDSPNTDSGLDSGDTADSGDPDSAADVDSAVTGDSGDSGDSAGHAGADSGHDSAVGAVDSDDSADSSDTAHEETETGHDSAPGDTPTDSPSDSALSDTGDSATGGDSAADSAGDSADASDPPVVLAIDALGLGDLVITEIHPNPSTCPDSWGEYFEFINLSGAPVDLAGLVIADNFATWTVPGPLVVEDGDLVLGVLDPGSSPQCYGLGGDFRYSSGILLSNGSDLVRLSNANGVIDDVVFSASWVGAGASMQLDPGSIDPFGNDLEASWCLSTHTMGGTADLGTPGAPNTPCP